MSDNIIENDNVNNIAKNNTKNNAKMVNLLFLLAVIFSLLANIFASLLSVKGIKISIFVNLLVSQTIILLPGLIFYLILNKNGEGEKLYKRIKLPSIFLLFVYTWLMMPLVSMANIFSQLFTSNEVINISGDLLELPFGLMVLIVGILGPFCEEFVFRGLIYKNLSVRSGRYIASATLSALFFGLMHMNLNQFCYAFVMGLIFALTNEVLDSVWPSFICHALVNTENVLLMYFADKLLKKEIGEGVAEYYGNSTGLVNSADSPQIKMIILLLLFLLFIVSIATTALAGLLLYGISVIEGKKDRFKMIFRKKTDGERQKILYFAGYLAMAICVFVIFLLEPLVKLLK